MTDLQSLRSLAEAAHDTRFNGDTYGYFNNQKFIAACDPKTILSILDRLEQLEKAAQAVVERWDTPLWKDVEPTAGVINRLRNALTKASP